ncbi:hypothetical protein EOM09_04365, partial [bacterium]|nr:hypothetical protein [bacterium]
LGAMHSSTGKNITPSKVLEVYEPEILKWLFAKYRPEDSFEFAFDETIIRHYSEYDKLLKAYASKQTTEIESEVFKLILDDATQMQEKTPFGSLASVAPIVDFNPTATFMALKKAGIEINQNSSERLTKVKNWIEIYNPEKKYDLLPKFNNIYYDSLDDNSKQVFSKLYEFISKNDFTEKEIQSFLYSIINDENATKKENILNQQVNFKNIYNMLFGRDDGPRLYLYLAAAEKNKYLNLLTPHA